LRRGEWEAADGVFGRRVPLPSVALGSHVRLVVGAGHAVLLGAGVSDEASYDVYVKSGVDRLGRDEFGEAVAHFMERDNAVALKRRLEARGETVHVERSFAHGLSEAAKGDWFSDYSRIPGFEPPSDQALTAGPGPSRESSGSLQTAEGGVVEEPRPGGEGPQEGTEPWWRRVFGG